VVIRGVGRAQKTAAVEDSDDPRDAADRCIHKLAEKWAR
jgi:hypothetical protein